MSQHRLVRILNRPKGGSLKFSLDNDVLSEILNNQNETTRFVQHLNANDIEIHISSEVHSESIFGGDRDRVVARQTNLVPILKTKKVRLLNGIREIVQGEMRHSFLPPLSPFRPDYFVENASVQFADHQWLGDVHDQTEHERKQHHDVKEWAHQSDKKLASILRTRPDWSSKDILADVRSFEGIAFKLRHFEYGLGVLQLGKKDLSIRKFKRHVERREARISLALATLVNFRYLLLLLGDQKSEFSHLRTTSRGAWHDVVNAASAGYSDFFVSNDGKLRDFCNCLANRKAIGFRAIEYSEFLAKFVASRS